MLICLWLLYFVNTSIPTLQVIPVGIFAIIIFLDAVAKFPLGLPPLLYS